LIKHNGLLSIPTMSSSRCYAKEHLWSIFTPESSPVQRPKNEKFQRSTSIPNASRI
jgi:hypothetical protein